MEAELDEFSREIYKMSKLFQQKQKKIQQELKKTLHRTAEEKREEEIKTNPTLTMCSSVLEQMKDFKVKEEKRKQKDESYYKLMLRDKC